MTKKLLNIILFAVLFSGFFKNTQAQDLHFSQFLYSPLNLNPAMAGNFDGRYRVAFNYRNQWRAISKAFQSTSISGDARDLANIKNLGLGALFYYDVAGTARYRTLSFGVPVSYRFNLTQDSVHSIIPGISPSFNHQGIDYSALTFDEQYNGNRFVSGSPITENLDNTNQNYLDLAAGITYKLQLKNGIKGTLGFALHNLLEPSEQYLAGTAANLGKRSTLHLGATVPLGLSFFLTPGLIYMKQANYQETMYGTEINYLTSSAPYRYRAFFIGGWNRGKDAAVMDLGMYYNTWRFGLSYDVNYSALDIASNNRGGWEVSIIYILRELLPKRTNFKHCPNYI